MSSINDIVRIPPASIPASGESRSSVVQVDITPHPGLPMAGYSSTGKLSRGVRGHLFARLFLFEDPAGLRSAICVLEMMSASRLLLEKTALFCAPLGLSVDRLILCGTHTHTGPGSFYGNSLYDEFASVKSGVDLGFVDWLAQRLATAMQHAVDELQPARIGVAETAVWGVGRNASLESFRANPEALQWDNPGWPGFGAPADLSAEQRAVDPRLRVLSVSDSDNNLLGALALFGCHTTTMGQKTVVFCPDWAGVACREALHRLASGDRPPIVAFAQTTAGDVNGLQSGIEQGPALARYAGLQVGQAIARCVPQALESSEPFSMELRYLDLDLNDRQVGADAKTVLSKNWAFGKPTIGGAADGRTLLFYTPLGRPGATSSYFPKEHPQHPKDPAFGAIQSLYAQYRKLSPSMVWPLRAFKLNEFLLVTVPGEPTVMVGHRLEGALKKPAGVKQVAVLGYAGDYAGYFTTPEEYALQNYEASSMLFGRHAATHIIERYRALLLAPANSEPASGVARFNSVKLVSRFSAEERGLKPTEHRPELRRDRQHVVFRWRMASDFRPMFCSGPLVLVEELIEESWEPMTIHGLPFDDVNAEIHLEQKRIPGGRLRRYSQWELSFELPLSLRHGPLLRLRLLPRGEFAGFSVPIPGE